MTYARACRDARNGRGHGGPALRAALVAALMAGVLLTAGPALAAPRPGSPVEAGGTSGDDFNMPDAAAVHGSHLFIANEGGNSVTELNASTGAHISTIDGSQFQFNGPTALTVVGKDLFVANGAGNSVTELTVGTRSLVRVISAASYGFSDPIALATNGSNLFVLNGAGSVTELATATGQLGGIASGSNFGFENPTAIVSAGSDLFVTNSAGNSVTEIDSDTMNLVTVLSSSTYDFDAPTGIAAHGSDVWVTNETGQSVTELSAATGEEMQVVTDNDDSLPAPGAIIYGDGFFFMASPPGSSPMVTQLVPSSPASTPWMMCNGNGPYTFSNPQALAVYGKNLWVVNEGGAGGPSGNSLTEMNASTGAFMQVVT
jgi:hypothetical protein